MFCGTFHLRIYGVPCCALIFLRTYPAPLTPYPVVLLLCSYLRIFFGLPCCAIIFLRAYPAAPLFFCALSLPLILFSLSYPVVP